ncbi:class I SAM-dependent methyltransferase [bacterium]|jgi:ubiquinone/menaquinone biosynthesis C-methylase UbiE|nr:class I SAM-dependent methyltransferase [bacterium]
MTYEKETKNAYRNQEKANAYKNQYIEGFKWARFTMWKQKRIIKNLLKECSLQETDYVLDVPCGAGYIGDLLSNIDSKIVASDISMEMMDLAIDEYKSHNFLGFIQSDITKMPLRSDCFKCAIVLALMHRLPDSIRGEVLSEVIRVTSKYMIISYSVESSAQKIKKFILKALMPGYIPAPASKPLGDILEELSNSNLYVRSQKRIVSFLSAKVVFLLEKK